MGGRLMKAMADMLKSLPAGEGIEVVLYYSTPCLVYRPCHVNVLVFPFLFQCPERVILVSFGLDGFSVHFCGLDLFILDSSSISSSG
jgi:hypothetical protein